MLEREQQGRIDLQVRHLIKQHFDAAQREYLLLPVPSLASISDTLYVSPRTLIRRLKSFKVSYKQLLEAERRIIAVALLEQARYSVSRVAEILGYKETANFCRAFKSWYGTSPTAFRRSPTKKQKTKERNL